MRRSVPLLVSALLITATPLLSVLPADAAKVKRCDGKEPTIVSSADEVTGTPRDDVIVVTGRGYVIAVAGAGDDTVCLRSRGHVQLDAGPGDDTVVSQERRGDPDTTLGAGDDTYVGSEGRDSVRDVDLRRGEPSGGVNRIRTGGGDDSVMVGHRRRASRDTVDLGYGDDSLALLRGADLRRASLTGGEGSDGLILFVPGRERMDVDAGTSTASTGGSTVARWSSFESYELVSAGEVAFTGSPADDTVTFTGRGPITAATAGGDDTIYVAPFVRAIAGSVDGGDGDDAIEYAAGDDVVAQVGAGTITAGGTTLAVASVESWTAQSTGRVELVGTAGDDELVADGCSVMLRGGAGNDQLTAGREQTWEGADVAVTAALGPGKPRTCRTPTSTVYGEAGDDVLIGGVSYMFFRGRSRERLTVLDGGEGTDVAVGGPARTTCIAETRVSCED